MIEIKHLTPAANVGAPVPSDIEHVVACFDVELDNGMIHGMWLYRDGENWRIAPGEHQVEISADTATKITQKALAAYRSLAA